MAREQGWILTLNAGSSSLKFAAYDPKARRQLALGQVAKIGAGAELLSGGSPLPVDAPDHRGALKTAIAFLGALGFTEPPASAGHRVVHGGLRTQAAVLDNDVRREIEAAAELAPLHNPPALDVMDALAQEFAQLPQIACFDTSFHASNPLEASTIAIPEELRDKGIRRYGFHGLSYASLVRRFADTTGQKLPRRLLAMHLGAGASLAAIVEGKGVATSMGFSPIDGLVMATRSGAIDPGVLIHLMRTESMDAAALDDLLNRKSGLLALSGGEPDMKKLLARQDERAKFALSHYCYWIARHAGSMIAAMHGIDGIVFTGGIGENAAPIREKILQSLSWTGIGDGKSGELAEIALGAKPNHWVINADEEGEIAHLTAQLVN